MNWFQSLSRFDAATRLNSAPSWALRFRPFGWLAAWAGAALAAQAADLVSLPPAPPSLAANRSQSPAGIENWWPGDGNTSDLQTARNGSVLGNVRFKPGKSAKRSALTRQWIGNRRGRVQRHRRLDIAGLALLAGNNDTNGQASSTTATWLAMAMASSCRRRTGARRSPTCAATRANSASFTEVSAGSSPELPWSGIRGFMPPWVRANTILVLYLNGKAAWYRQAEHPLATVRSFAISMEQPLTFNGLIDEAALFNKGLSPADLELIVGRGQRRDVQRVPSSPASLARQGSRSVPNQRSAEQRCHGLGVPRFDQLGPSPAIVQPERDFNFRRARNCRAAALLRLSPAN